MDYKSLAKKIFDITGPEENILHAANCMTRLRLQLAQAAPETAAQLKALEGVIGVNQADTELQVILGPGAAEQTAAAFQQLLQAARSQAKEKAQPAPSGQGSQKQGQDITPGYGIGDGKKLHAEIKAKNATPFKLLLKKISGIFIPLIPGFIACGLITGLLNLLLKSEPSLADMAWIKMLAIMGNAIFYGMNLFVGFNAAKEFGGSPILGGILAAVITHPALKDIMLGNEQLLPGRGGIIAVLLVTAFGAWLELRLRKIIPTMLDLLLTPLLTILIAGFAALFILQPVGGIIATAIGDGVTIAIHEGGALTGFILGGLWLPIVMLGIHQAMTPIHVQLIQEYGVTLLLPILAMAGCGQIGACLAVYFKTKNKFLKKTILSALPVGIMGIGEPLIYGVTLPLGRPFITACIGGAFGGAVQAAFSIGSSAIGISGLPLTTVTSQPLIYLLGILTSYIAGFALTWLAGFDEPEEQQAPQ
ncbi:MAG: PTS transporter subunit EIIC [Anaerovibrio sp.]|uniref:PTS transporter subunit EIIC n=1 Tax=Anaerovibrio sp. TaxID=1872532 RepID=UPI00262731BF|nr:PTS transporter subunit EIIC [Anaerovibrio sp.]MDD7678233.1 PTS transporter subunit EIIC [Anaerovibrio sp.]MDY2604164.1 PTS transporter subunit EIIC [Anaerovibrio sp.]